MPFRGVGVAGLMCLALAMAGCTAKKPPATAPHVDVGLGQGWTQAQRDSWYEATQGSRLLPYAWAKALEAPEGGVPFFSPQHMQTFGYLAPEATSSTGLPVGFVIDDNDDTGFTRSRLRWFETQGPTERWLGMNCAACHTAEITYNGKSLRIDGGPGLADYQTFIETFDAALTATRTDPARWDRFAVAVLGANDTPANRTLLTSAFDSLIAWQKKVATRDATSMRYGPARLDAVGLILNRVSLIADPNGFATAPDAPVSYPFIWNISQTDKLQWNGMAANKTISGPGGVFDYGALGRNVGEVTGVFADIVYKANPGLDGYRSTVQIANLDAMEKLVAKLMPPAWPADMLGPIDAVAAAEGETLFTARCARCHEHLARTDLTTKFPARISLFRSTDPASPAPGTDIWMACNAYTSEARTGVLAGTKRRYLNGTVMGAVEPSANLLSLSVIGTIIGKKKDLAGTAVSAWLGVDRAPRVVTSADARSLRDDREERRERCMSEENETLGYKARPLTGIWATAPYLHNGSAPTLYSVLLPPEERPRAFAVGGREYDPVRVGYSTEPTAANRFIFNTHANDKPIDGNSSAGHDYGNASLSDEQRRALVEYMKTL